ncbi:MAG TPA: HAD family hydrolase [Candidatus Bathyarchaeia archaeon]
MGPRVKVIFFELGETLVTQNIEDNMVTRQALREIARILPQRPREDLFKIYQRGYRINHSLRSRHHVEIPVETWMRQLLRRALGRNPEDRLVNKAIKIIVKSRAANAVAFKDAKPTLEKLSKRGTKLAVISNVSSHEVALRILKNVGLRKYFDQVITSAHTGIRKPDPGIFLYALMQFGLKPIEAVHVGDSEEHDVWGAKATGIRTVLISRRAIREKTVADFYFRNLAEAADLLQSL